ncbi:MAG: ribonuclease H [Candidatus Omnitrophica bacterium CG11_big_fil_rev_8_21_14_0_20_64_10]|nr:MAG: ribonuclease H [Candidatus Omnitrophica bacterium CG11_big_fil_rev_8_21_14_0_20_64_10]
MHIDGAARGNPGPAGVGLHFTPPKSKKPVELSFFLGVATNNVAETTGLILALQEGLKRGYRSVTVRTDSELLAHQVGGLYKVKDRQLQWLHLLIRNLIPAFKHFEITHVPREKNRTADRLANQAVWEGLRKHPHLKQKAQPAPVESPEPLDSDQPTLF